MIYLLSTQVLLDLLTGEEPIATWLRGIPLQPVEISAVSIGQALETIQQVKSIAARKNLERQLSIIVATANNSQGVIPFDEDAAGIWSELQGMTLKYRKPDGTMTDLSSESRMVVATALDRGATLVEAPQPYHQAIQRLTVESP
jgi:predicted nucleic acid-binding protein